MEDIENQKRHNLIMTFGFGQGNLKGKNVKRNLNRSIHSVKKAKTGHRLDGQRRSQRVSGVFAVDQAGISQKMDVHKSEKKKQTEAVANPLSKMGSHSTI